MKKSFLLFFLLGIYFSFEAQNSCLLKGRVTDKEGNAIPYCSIYLPSIALGSMANIDGEYSFNVPCKEFEIVYQSLGFETKKIVRNLNGTNEIDLQLGVVSYQLQAVTIDPSSEDPAYNYIRKATAMAEYYKKQISAYKANLYIRSFQSIDNIPWIAEKLATEDDIKEMKAGEISETLLEYSYERPNTITEKIIAKKSGNNDTSKTGSQYINLNFYNLGGPGIVNPLSRNAFQVYKFEHIHTYFEGSQAVHKIKIIPRRKGNDLMKGHLYINDKLWNINNVDVVFDQPLATIRYQQLYNEVNPYVWMPINHQIKATVKAIGFELDINYLATLSNLEVKADPSINAKIIKNLKLNPPNQNELAQIPGEVKLERTKTESKIENILQKDKISKAESLKLVRLIKKQEKEEELRHDTAKSLEIQMIDRKTEYADSAFSTNDSLWNTKRNIPLSEREIQIYAANDTLNKINSGDTVINDPQSTFNKILWFNSRTPSKNKNIRFQPKGLFIGVNGGFNTVDGFNFQKELLTYEWNNRKGKYYLFTPWAGYAFSRDAFQTGVDFKSQYNMQKRAGFFFSVGSKSADFNQDIALSPFVNSISTLFFVENYKKFYQNDYATVGHEFDLFEGFHLITSVNFQDRTQLENNSPVKWNSSTDKAYTTNIPSNNYVSEGPNLIQDNKSFVIDVVANYSHKQHYWFRDGKKQMRVSKFPSIELNYKQGLSDVIESNSQFQFLSVAIKHATRIQLIDQVSYQLEAGKFLDRKEVYFADFKNFNAQPFYFMSSNELNTYKLIDSYDFSTNDYYLSGHFKVEDNHLLLKYLPILNTSNFTESISFNYLFTEQETHYSELGYSLNRIFLFIDVGAYVGFRDDEFDSWGVRITVRGPFNN